MKSLFSDGIWIKGLTELRLNDKHVCCILYDCLPNCQGIGLLCPVGYGCLYVSVCLCIGMCHVYTFTVVIWECVYAPGFKLQLITHITTWGGITMQCHIVEIIFCLEALLVR